MAGRGFPPKPDQAKRNRNPVVHDWKVAPAGAWQGEIPEPPEGLMPAAVEAWHTWFSSWFAAFWTPSDVPALRQLIRVYDQVERGEFQRHGELRLGMDTYGITPKGQQDRRWRPPAEDTQATTDGGSSPEMPGGRFAGLTVVKPA